MEATLSQKAVVSAEMAIEVAGAIVLRQQFGRMLAREAGTRAGQDVEALHQMRVATRRLRAAIKLFATPDTATILGTCEEDLRNVAQVLGAVRDLDVFRDDLRTYAEGVPEDASALDALLHLLEAERDRRRATLLEMLDGPIMARLRVAFPVALDRFEEAADLHSTLGETAPNMIERRLRRVRKAGKALMAPTSLELHTLRILCKRLRYACEFFQPLYRGTLADTISLLTSIQDALGTLHDADVAPDTLLALLAVEDAHKQGAGRHGRRLAVAALRFVERKHRLRDEMLEQFRGHWPHVAALKQFPLPDE